MVNYAQAVNRTKTWNRDRFGTVKSYHGNTPSSPWVEVSSWQSPFQLENGYLLGVDIPRFHARRAAGELLPHTYFEAFNLKGYSSSEQCNWRVETATAEKDKFEPHFGWLKTYAPTVTSLRDRGSMMESLIQKAAVKVMSENSFDLSTFFAELGPTFSMFKKVGTRLLKITNDVRKYGKDGLTKDKYQRSDTEMSLWLEARYGWRTLVYDLQDLSEAIQSLGGKEGMARFSEKCWNIHELTEVRTEPINYYYGSMMLSILDEFRIIRKGSVVIDAYIDLFQVNPFVTIWEMIPYSFVIDWFIQVGNMLTVLALDAVTVRSQSSCGYEVKQIRTVNGGMTFKPGYTGDVRMQLAYEATFTLREPRPIPYLPLSQLRLNEAKIFDIIALIGQIRR